MKKIDTTSSENISAYIDNELDPSKREQIEEVLQKSNSAREELHQLRSVKELVQSIPALEEDTSFETRLMERINVGDGRRERIWTRKPVIGLAFATVAIMLVMKFQPQFLDELMNSHKNKINDFYTKNLKPLLYATDLNEDDILNFAFNKSLPINKENAEVLKLNTGSNGEQIMEVSLASLGEGKLNTDEFAKNLGLNSDQKTEFKKILSKYSDKIASAVLVNENNTLAVNSALWQYHNDLRRDLLSFVSQTGNNALQKVMSPQQIKELVTVRNPNLSNANSNTYYFITPDTVFQAPLELNSDSIQFALTHHPSHLRSDVSMIRDDIKRIKLELASGYHPGAADLSAVNGLRVTTDSNLCRVIVPSTGVRTFTPDVAAISSRLDSVYSVMREFSFQFNIPDNNAQDIQVEVTQPADIPAVTRHSSKESAVIIPRNRNNRSSARDSLIEFGNGYIKINPQQLLDSLHNMMKYYFNDSGATGGFNFPKPLDQMKKEIDQLKKEIQRYKQDTQKSPKKSKTFIQIKNVYEI